MRESSSFFLSTVLDLLGTSWALTSVAYHSTFDIFILNMLTGTWIFEFFDSFSCLITISVSFSFFCYCFLTSVFYHRLLADGFACSSSHPSEATWLEWLESSLSESTLWSEISSSEASSKTSSEKVIIFIESRSHHSKVCKWISVSSLFLLLSILIILIHSPAKSSSESTRESMSYHSSTKTLSNTSSKEIIIFIEKVGKWISSSKKFFKDIISISELLEVELLATATTSTCFWSSTLFKEFFAILIEIFSLLIIT